ncbi:uncharacterized protein LOC124284633 [Haliotis rubra]|uniref:uncharacterized protein LOC124284633 n=1 Tax=Haliotis rubra TaxID=36100 RepID=UPI001EE611BF|nr:uncharacterized protein LOC124284633 [Haliotis rubra]
MNALLLAVAVLCLMCVGSQRIRPRSLCVGNQIFPTRSTCSKTYFRCDNRTTIRGSCLEDMYLGPNNSCEPRAECGSPSVSRRGRRKRQTGSGSPGQCNQKFDCPQNLVFYIYPDWDNCTQFNTCREGVVETVSCSIFNLKYYNPNLFSCEVDLDLDPVTPQNNVCLNRAVRFGK